MANNCRTAIQIQKRCQQQTNRENYEGHSTDFYRNSVFIPYNLISQLETRFHQINLPLSTSSSIRKLKFSQNAKVTRALTGRRLARPVDFFIFIYAFI